MNPIRSFIAPAVLMLLMVSCMQQPDMADIRETVDAFNAASSAAMTSGQTDNVLKFYSDSAVTYAPNMAPIRGKEAIKAWMEQMAKSEMKVTLAKFTTTDLGASGTVAYEIGTYEMTMQEPSMGEMNDSGNYLSIWTKQSDGSWKIHAEIWNSTLPVAGVDMNKEAR